MPFWLTNAPSAPHATSASWIEPEGGNEFVTAYTDDVHVFSPTFHEHLDHLLRVMDRLREINLKLNPLRCKFVREEVGLKLNPRLTDAVQKFPQPQTVQDTRRFLGLSSYYHRFIPKIARVAHPLHWLTAKGSSSAGQWSVKPPPCH